MLEDSIEYMVYGIEGFANGEMNIFVFNVIIMLNEQLPLSKRKYMATLILNRLSNFFPL
jgi:hypothetical protein